MKTYKIACIPGDGIGKEVIPAGQQVLEVLARSQGDLRFEPIDALTDHADGLSAYRRIITDAVNHLEDGGWLLMEHGYDQSEAVQQLLSEADFHEVQSWPDLAGILRVSGGKK